ncbi:MAG: sulfatase-like hydrolase/transferase [Terracidiphilus sp.]
MHKAMAPSYMTFASHSAMFVGFTPGLATVRQSLLNPKYGKLFRLEAAGFPGRQPGAFQLSGPNIISGFRRLGYATIGSGGVGWFDPQTETGQVLSRPFEHFYYPGKSYCLEKQIRWIMKYLEGAAGRPVFVFLNIGETHVPYYFKGAPWRRDDNPCVPFQTVNRSADCRVRQAACVEYVDGLLAELLAIFSRASTIICADHGDCWGEDGLWEHGISHERTLTVPLILRVRGQAIGLCPD